MGANLIHLVSSVRKWRNGRRAGFRHQFHRSEGSSPFFRIRKGSIERFPRLVEPFYVCLCSCFLPLFYHFLTTLGASETVETAGIRSYLHIPKQTKTRMSACFSSIHAGLSFGAKEGTRTPKDKPHAPQTCASASSATFAYCFGAISDS